MSDINISSLEDYIEFCEDHGMSKETAMQSLDSLSVAEPSREDWETAQDEREQWMDQHAEAFMDNIQEGTK